VLHLRHNRTKPSKAFWQAVADANVMRELGLTSTRFCYQLSSLPSSLVALTLTTKTQLTFESFRALTQLRVLCIDALVFNDRNIRRVSSHPAYGNMPHVETMPELRLFRSETIAQLPASLRNVLRQLPRLQLLDARSFVTNTDKQSSSQKCALCSFATNQKCSGCKQLYYCSRACQFDDWKRHKPICKANRKK
jgi:hypothetical protein